MRQYEGFDEYVSEACEQVRCKKARPDIAEELKNHLEDQQTAFTVMGMPEDEAKRETMRQMGDPVMVGMELDRAHRPKPDWIMLFTVMALVVLGASVQFAIVGNAGQEYHSILTSLTLAIPIGILVMLAAYFLDFTILAKYPLRLYLAATIFFVLFPIFVTGMGRPWLIDYLQYMLLLFVPLYCGVVYAFKNKGRRGMLACGFYALIPMALAFIYPAPTALLIVAGGCCTILCAAVFRDWFGGKDKSAILPVLIPLVGAAVLYIILLLWQSNVDYLYSGGVFGRFGGNTVAHIAQHAQNNRLGIWEILANARFIGPAIENGAVIGTAFFQSDLMLIDGIAKYGWWIGILIVGGIIALIVRMFRLALRQSNKLAFFISLGISAVFAIQSAIFLLANFGVLTIRTLSLPLILCTGWGLVISMCLAGLFLSVYKYKGIVSERAMQTAP